MSAKYPVSSNSPEVNNVIEELYLENLSDTELLEFSNIEFSIIVEHQPATDNDLYIGICMAPKTAWENKNVICSQQITDQSSRRMTLFTLASRNDRIRGYIVVNPTTELHVSKIRLNDYVANLNCWPKIKKFLETGFIYCDSVNGRFNWPGTVDYPLNTIEKALTYLNRVSLRDGRTYYEPIKATDCVITAHGNEDRPLICGLKAIKSGIKPWTRGRINSAGEWIQSSTGNIWKIDLSKTSNFFGVKAGSGSKLNNIGGIVDVKTDKLCGARKMPKLKDLQSNFDFWQFYEILSRDNYISDYDFLYLYLESDPNEMQLGFTCGAHGFEGNGKLISLAFKYWGRHGLLLGSNSHVSGCSIDGAGGSIHTGQSAWNCYGNGIEIWVSAEVKKVTNNITVEYCDVSRCFDAGITIQGGQSTNDPGKYDTNRILAWDITFDNISVVGCRYGIESFIHVPPETADDHASTLRNCAFKNCKISANRNFQQDIHFRHSNKYGKSEPDERWALRLSSTYSTGLTIDSCRFSNPSFLVTRLDKENHFISASLTNCTAEVKGGDVIFEYSNKSGGILKLPQFLAGFDSVIKEFRKFCPDQDIVFTT